jgi:carbamoyl-phosphate synthase large subunit
MARLATRLMLGEQIEQLNLSEKKIPHYGAKEAVFPFEKFSGVDPVLGPEMRSTGEVLGMSENSSIAYLKSQEGAGLPLPRPPAAGETAKVLVSLSDKDNLRDQSIEVGKSLVKLGFSILATEGTAKFFEENNIPCQIIAKLNEGRPNVIDVIVNREICLAINTPSARAGSIKDEAAIRKAVIKYKIPYITTLAAASAAVKGMAASRNGKGGVKSLQEYHAEI